MHFVRFSFHHNYIKDYFRSMASAKLSCQDTDELDLFRISTIIIGLTSIYDRLTEIARLDS